VARRRERACVLPAPGDKRTTENIRRITQRSIKEVFMNLTSLIPFRGRASLARTDVDMFGSLQREIDRLFDDFMRGAALPAAGAGLVPSIDISESDNEIEITAELPGLERKDVDISVEDDVLIVRGEKKIETQSGNGQQDNKQSKQGKQAQQEGEGAKSRRVTERMYGAFYRAIQLPPGVDTSKIEATMSKGVLKIRIPKPPQSQPKKIEVKEAA
jgi:HSP20 family protein